MLFCFFFFCILFGVAELFVPGYVAHCTQITIAVTLASGLSHDKLNDAFFVLAKLRSNYLNLMPLKLLKTAIRI